MMTWISLVSLLVVFVVRTDARAYRNAMWQDCTRADSPVTLTNMLFSPNAISMPGRVYLTMEGFSNQTLTSSRLVLDITRVGWFNLPIPCISNIGSCTYDDTCTLLTRMINENWLGISRDIGTQIEQMLVANGLMPSGGPGRRLCPQPARVISIQNHPLDLPRMPRILFWFAEGLYRANVKVIDNANNQELLCFNLDVNVGPTPEPEPAQDECTGYFCWVGRK